MIPQALAQQGYQDPYEAQRQQLMARMAAPQAPMYTPEVAQERQDTNQREYQLGILGMLSGNEQMGNVGGMVLKRALAQRDPTVSERGTTDQLSGKFTYSPDYLRRQDEGQLAGLDTKSAQSRERYETDRRGFADRQELQRQRAEDQMERARLSGTQGKVGKFINPEYTPDGRHVVTNSESGLRYLVKVNPDGSPEYTPYGGITTPKGSYETAAKDAGEQLEAAANADKLLNEVKASPEAFGLRGAAVSHMPTWAQGYAAQALQLTPEQLTQRAKVLRQAAVEIHKLYGAALQGVEAKRANMFLATDEDQPEQIIAKLEAARDYAYESAKRKGPAAMNAASQRGGLQAVPMTGAPAPAAGGWSIKRLP